MRVTQDLYQMYKKNRFFKRWQWGEGENEWVSERVSVGGVMAVKWKTQKEKGKRYSPISGDDFAGQPSKHFKIENVNWAWWEKEREEEKEKSVRRRKEGEWTFEFEFEIGHRDTVAYWYLLYSLLSLIYSPLAFTFLSSSTP